MKATSCIVNGLKLEAPDVYLEMLRHCLVAEQPVPTFCIEEAHFQWAVDRLKSADVALDIGSSVGLFTVGFSRKVGRRGHVYAFEPAREAATMLREFVARNALPNVTIQAAAVSDVPGKAEFHELPADDRCTWRPEASGLTVDEKIPGTRTYEVPVTTVDQYMEGQRGWLRRPRVALIKIDIEGYEAHALRGAKETITRDRPAFCIDIHRRWDGDGDTEPDVRSILSPFGYTFESRGHVLLCSPSPA